MMRKALMLTATFALTTAGLGIGAAASGAESSTTCSFVHEPDLSPGLSYEPTSGTFTDPGGGTVSCDGPVNGHTPTGEGSYVDSGEYGTTDPDTCQGGGEAIGNVEFVVPTEGGPQTVTDTINIKYGEPSTNGGVVHATFEGEKSSGTIELTPLAGDCVVNPVTKIRGAGELILK